MLGLSLRAEFTGTRVKGSSTAIELSNSSKTGATQVPAEAFLDITYPTTDILVALEAIAPDRGRPVVLIGERGQGKSHLMAVLYHALHSPESTWQWLIRWGERLENSRLATMELRPPMHIISEGLHRQTFRYLWDVLFDRHPHGGFIRGKWEGRGPQKTDVPGEDLLLELFAHTPTALILDEFQTWYEGLADRPPLLLRQWAFNFIQLLSEIAASHPDRLLLVVSVRSGDTEAYRQVHRVNPVVIDFKGPNARQDRQNLLLHRLFTNRHQIPQIEIERVLATHIHESFRLAAIPPAGHDQARQEFIHAWPFASHLLRLLEDQVLVATQAQETRDLIRILADLYKEHGDSTPVLTAGDFRVDDERSNIASLLDSVANQHHASLRDKAMRNLVAVAEATRHSNDNLPHLSQIVGALWLRSLATGNLAGADTTTLQLDVTRDKVVDDNEFAAEMETIADHGFNIHREAGRYVFRETENAEAKLRSHARNDKIFVDGSDKTQLRLEIAYVIGGLDVTTQRFTTAVLPIGWKQKPWETPEESPLTWDERIPLVVIPEPLPQPNPILGPWLKEHVQKRRNAVRFLLPQDSGLPLYYDPELITLSRMVVLANQWKADSPEYKALAKKFQGDLNAALKGRFDKFAILDTWNFPNPEQCTFTVTPHRALGSKIPDAVDAIVTQDLFVPEDFEEYVLQSQQAGESVGTLLQALQEPRPNGEHCIPWLGETAVKERILRLCARGKLAVSVRNQECLQVKAGEDEETTWHRIRGRLPTGRHLQETFLTHPQASLGSTGQTSNGQPAPTPVTVPEQGGPPPLLFDPFIQTMTFLEFNTAPTSALNLMAKVKETWNIGAGTQVRKLVLKADSLTGDQLDRLLKNLPDGLQYELSLVKEER